MTESLGELQVVCPTGVLVGRDHSGSALQAECRMREGACRAVVQVKDLKAHMAGCGHRKAAKEEQEKVAKLEGLVRALERTVAIERSARADVEDDLAAERRAAAQEREVRLNAEALLLTERQSLRETEAKLEFERRRLEEAQQQLSSANAQVSSLKSVAIVKWDTSISGAIGLIGMMARLVTKVRWSDPPLHITPQQRTTIFNNLRAMHQNLNNRNDLDDRLLLAGMMSLALWLGEWTPNQHSSIWSWMCYWLDQAS